MKTTFIPIPQFGGYPLEWSETVRQKFPGQAAYTATKSTANNGAIRTVPTPDIPENWDESWFASYE